MTYPLAMHPRNRLRELRKAAGLSQVELAARTGVSQSTISQLENDAIELDVPWMRALSRELGCRPVDLLADRDNPDRLSDEERLLIQSFRAATTQQRQLISRVAEPVEPFAGAPPENDDERRRA